MSESVKRKIRKTGFILSVICLMGSVVMFTQIPPGTPGRTAMILTGITALLVGLSLYSQLKQNEP
jgi:hypothetical protein